MQPPSLNRPQRLAHALELERAGQSALALAELLALDDEARDSPQLLVHLGRALSAANRAAEAEARVEAALASWPVDAALHALLVELRWARGAGAQSTALLEDAIAAHPLELGLRLVAADLLRNMGEPQRALALLRTGLERAPHSAAFLTSFGVVLDDLDRSLEALPYLQAAVARGRDKARMQANLVPVLLRCGQAAAALEVSESLLAVTPDDQKLIAYRATALRMLGDPRYAPLCDHARLVRAYELVPPPEFRDIGAFNVAFARELQALHHSRHRPISQSLRGGTQTERNLPAGNPVIDAFFAMLDAPIRDYISRLDPADREHPTDRRVGRGYRIGGSWSVRLASGGFHTNHVHPQGWLSSAYYVELPPVEDEQTRAGWLKFGEPGVRLDLAPELHVQPRPGMLVLFPSFFWHGTVPFERGGGRLTAALDVVPVG